MYQNCGRWSPKYRAFEVCARLVAKRPFMKQPIHKIASERSVLKHIKSAKPAQLFPRNLPEPIFNFLFVEANRSTTQWETQHRDGKFSPASIEIDPIFSAVLCKLVGRTKQLSPHQVRHGVLKYMYGLIDTGISGDHMAVKDFHPDGLTRSFRLPACLTNFDLAKQIPLTLRRSN